MYQIENRPHRVKTCMYWHIVHYILLLVCTGN